MKKFLKRILSVSLAAFMIMDSAPLLHLVGINHPFINSFMQPTAEAASSDFLEPFKIVLRWGASPRDLDSHLEGTLSNGSSFHCYYANQKIYDGSTLVADLDVDDTSGYGPETITITPSALTGTYTYYIYNYTGSGSFSGAGATAELYYGDKVVQTVSVPSGSGSGRYWSLFKFVNGKVYIINSVGTSVSSSSGELIDTPVINEIYNEIERISQCAFAVEVKSASNAKLNGAEVSVYLGGTRIANKQTEDGIATFVESDFNTKKDMDYILEKATISAHYSLGNGLELCSEDVLDNGAWAGTKVSDVVNNETVLVCDEPRWYVRSLRVMINESKQSSCQSVLKDYSSHLAQATNGHVIANKFEIVSVPDSFSNRTSENLEELSRNNNIDICMVKHSDNSAWANVDGFGNSNGIIWCPINNSHCAKTLCHESGHYLFGFFDEYASAIGYYESQTNGNLTNPNGYNTQYAYDTNDDDILQNRNNTSEGREQYAAYWDEHVSSTWNGAISRPEGAPNNFGLMEVQSRSIEMSTAEMYNNITITDYEDYTLQYAFNNNSSCEETLEDVLASMSGIAIDYTNVTDTQTAKYSYAGGKNVSFTYSSITSANSVSMFSEESNDNESTNLSAEVKFDYNGLEFNVVSSSEVDVILSDIDSNIIYELTVDETNEYEISFELNNNSTYQLAIVEYVEGTACIVEYSLSTSTVNNEIDLSNRRKTINLGSNTETNIVIITSKNEPVIDDYISLTKEYIVTYDDGAELGGYIEKSVEHNLPVDYSSMTWLYNSLDGWNVLETDVLFDDHGNPMASCTYAGEGAYCLVAKGISDTTYTTPTDFTVSTDGAIYDGEVIATFTDSNENVMYYNIYYGTEAITVDNYGSMDVQIVDSSSTQASILFDNSDTTYYFAIQAVSNDGSKSEISECVSCKGALIDSNGDGFHDSWINTYSALADLEDIAGTDTDDDGLTNLQEYKNGTNPLNPDTDGDNVYDSVELWNDLNPLEPMTDGENDDYIVVYGTSDVYIDEDSFFVDGSNITCTIGNNADGKAMRTHIYLYSAAGELIELSEVNLNSNSSVDYTFSRDFLEEGMRIVLDEEQITRDIDCGNNEFIYIPSTSIVVSNPEITLVKGLTAQLEYVLTPEGASRIVEWKSADENIVSVNKNGLITGTRIGKTTITVTTISGFTGTYSILVEPFPGAGETDFDCQLISDNTELEIIGYYGSDTNITIPDLIGGYPVTSIADGAFDGCVFESVVINTSINNIGLLAFNGAANLKSIEVTEDNTAYSSVDGVLYNADKTVLIRYPVAKENVSFAIPDTVATVDVNAFNGTVALSTIVIPESVTTISSKSFANMNLTNVNYGGSKRLWSKVSVASDSGLSGIMLCYGKFTATFIGEGETISQTDYKPGETIVIPDNVPEKKYYTFADWTPAVPETMPEYDLDFTAVYELSDTTRTVEYYVDGVLYWSDYRYEGEIIDTPETVPTKVGYTFLEWSPDVAETMPDENIVYEVVWTINSHQVSFIVDGEIYNSYECAYDDMLTIPEDPTKEGYTFVGWTPAIPESMPDMDMEFTAVFEAITYTATFMEGETVVGTDEFTVEDTELDLSVVEYREGYEYVYDDYEIAANDIVINGRYDVITYTATFVIDGETVSAQQFTVEDMTIEEPEISHKDGYTYAWEEYEVQLADFTVNAIYTPIVYTATFMDGETVVGTDEFTVEDTILDYPETTVKEHYDWVWDDYEIIADNITVAGGYVPVVYTASFVADGVVVDEVEFNIENQSVVAPEIPEKAGYTAAWDTYEINLADFVVNAIYTPIVYTATFTHNGEVIGTDDFTVEDVSLNYPTMETKEYYDWIWDEHEIIADDITVNGEYVPITYTIKFVSNGKTVKTQSFTVETVDTVTQPSFSLPSKAGYYSDWEEWEGKICNLTVNEVYVPIKYTASFYCDNKLIISRTFTVETKIEQLPAPKAPTRAGYYAVWDEYSIVARDMEIHARYVPIEYSAQFVADGVVISTQKFTVETESLDEPDIPQKAGYIARWSSYKIEARDLTIIAKYHLPEVVTVSKRTLDVGETFRLLPTCNFDATEKSWTSSDTSVATVNQHGKVTAVGKGECEITITCYGKDSLGNDIQASKVTKIIVNDKSEPQNFKQSFREKFNEFFEVTLYDLLYNLREFMIVLFKYVW